MKIYDLDKLGKFWVNPWWEQLEKEYLDIEDEEELEEDEEQEQTNQKEVNKNEM